TAITVSGSIQIDRASLSLEGFACAAVPRIAATPTSGIAFLISHMIAHLGLQTTLEDAADQLGQKPALARQRDPVGASLIDKLINVFIADQLPPPLTCRRRRARICTRAGIPDHLGPCIRGHRHVLSCIMRTNKSLQSAGTTPASRKLPYT